MSKVEMKNLIQIANVKDIQNIKLSYVNGMIVFDSIPETYETVTLIKHKCKVTLYVNNDLSVMSRHFPKDEIMVLNNVSCGSSFDCGDKPEINKLFSKIGTMTFCNSVANNYIFERVIGSNIEVVLFDEGFVRIYIKDESEFEGESISFRESDYFYNSLDIIIDADELSAADVVTIEHVYSGMTICNPELCNLLLRQAQLKVIDGKNSVGIVHYIYAPNEYGIDRMVDGNNNNRMPKTNKPRLLLM